MQVGEFPTFVAGAALPPYVRVKLVSGQLQLASGSEAEVGTTLGRAFAQGDLVAVLPRELAVVRKCVAVAAFAQFAPLFAAANGKVDDSGTLPRGVALEAASGDGAIVNVLSSQAATVST